MNIFKKAKSRGSTSAFCFFDSMVIFGIYQPINGYVKIDIGCNRNIVDVVGVPLSIYQ